MNRVRPRNPVLFSAVALAVLMVVLSACAPGPADVGGFNLGEVYTLQNGQQVSEDLVVVASDIFLEAGSVVRGTTTLIGGNVVFDGEIQGDAIVVADRLKVGDAAHVSGDLILCIKDFDRSERAVVEGEVQKKCVDSGSVSLTNVIDSSWNTWRGSVWFRLSMAIVGALLFGAIAALVTMLFPRPLVRMSESIFRAPGLAGGVGFLTFLVAGGLTALYVISLLLVLPVVLLPLIIIAWAVLVLFSLVGWVALAGPFGIYLLRVAGLGQQPRMISAAVGGVVLVLLLRVWSVFWFTAWIGIMATIILGSIGLGVVILTRAGTRPFPRFDTVG